MTLTDNLQIKKLAVPPLEFDANTLYAIPGDGDDLHLYLSSSDGTSVRNIPTKDQVVAETIVFDEEAPDIDAPQLFWFDMSNATLMVKYDDGDRIQWVEPTPSLPFPAFGGNGVSDTMARSDHFHTGITIENPQW